MKVECKLDNIAYDFAQKRTKFQFSCYGDITSSLEEYLGKNLNVDLKREKRSNNANSYLWVLLGEMQEKLKIPKEDIYRHIVEECGVYEVIPIRNDALEKFRESWEHNGLGWTTSTQTSKLNGYTNVVAYYGTSVYSKDEMSVILSSVVEECIDLGIPTKKKEDINNLLEEWK